MERERERERERGQRMEDAGDAGVRGWGEGVKE